MTSCTIWALSDPHLALGIKDKSMDVFGPDWKDHAEKIAHAWNLCVAPHDLVLVPGDISWAMRLEDAAADFAWLEKLPGIKLILRGNHDYWWGSSAKLKKFLPPSVHFIHNSTFDWHDISIGGSRLWDTHEYSFNSFINYTPNPRAKNQEPSLPEDSAEQERVFIRELERLDRSLEQLNPKAKHRIAITHYPPIGADLAPSRASAILEKHKIEICVFGHLHSLKKEVLPLFGEARGIRYVLASCDAIDFTPIRILSQ